MELFGLAVGRKRKEKSSEVLNKEAAGKKI
jgi:hypothetical protein